MHSWAQKTNVSVRILIKQYIKITICFSANYIVFPQNTWNIWSFVNLDAGHYHCHYMDKREQAFFFFFFSFSGPKNKEGHTALEQHHGAWKHMCSKIQFEM